MIRKLTEDDREALMTLICKEPALNLFIIGDVENFGFEQKFMDLWGEFNYPAGQLKAVLLRFYRSYLPYAEGPFDVEGFAEIMRKDKDITMISGKSDVIQAFSEAIQFRENKQMLFAEMKEMTVDIRAAASAEMEGTELDIRAAVSAEREGTELDTRASVSAEMEGTELDIRAAVCAEMEETELDIRAAVSAEMEGTELDIRAAVERTDIRAAVCAEMEETKLDIRAAVCAEMEETELDIRAAVSAKMECLGQNIPDPFSLPDIIKTATVNDVEAICSLTDTIDEFEFSPEGSRANLRNTLESGTGRTYYMEREGQVIATASTSAENSMSAMILAVATHKAYRGQGLASRVVAALCADLLSEGKSACLFYDNPQAGTIYKRLGFHDIGSWSMAFM